MAVILGLVGSPRREQGFTHRAVSAVLQGAKEQGAQVQLEYLADWGLETCVDCGAPCFADATCARSESVSELTRLVNAADGLVIGAPVYVWQVNGLTHAFMDRYRRPGNAALARQPNGRPAVAVTVAGGTGTGIAGATRSLLDFLCLWGYRALEPVLVTRYNLAQALETARVRGGDLVKVTGTPRPFKGVAELLAYYDELQFSCTSHLDEMIWLAEQAMHLGHPNTNQIKQLCAEARAVRYSDPAIATEKAVRAFELGRGPL